MLRKSFFIFLFLIIILEGIATYFLPYRNVEKADVAVKNDFGKRAWPEYTSAVKDPNKKLVIIIGNSQAYGEEHQTDSNRNYTFWLKQYFKDKPVCIENWSEMGIRTTDIEILTTKAMIKGADLILLPLNMTNFDGPERINLTFPNTDVNLLLADPAMWKPMRQSQVAASFEKETYLNKWCTYHSSLIRSRNPVFLSIAEERQMSFEEQIFFFGNPITRYRIPDIKGLESLKEKVAITTPKQVSITPEEIKQRTANASRFFYYLKQRADMLNAGKIVVIWHPLCKAMAPSDYEWDLLLGFKKRMIPVLEKRGFKVLDHSEQVPDAQFQSMPHFNGNGHQYYYKELIPVINNELQ